MITPDEIVTLSLPASSRLIQEALIDLALIEAGGGERVVYMPPGDWSSLIEAYRDNGWEVTETPEGWRFVPLFSAAAAPKGGT